MSGVPEDLWSKHSEDELRDLYDDWAARYDADMEAGEMLGPMRCAEMMTRMLPDRDAPILDFGCGIGLSGKALTEAGYGMLHGTDLSPAMLARAEARGVYRSTLLADPGAKIVVPEGVGGVVASGSISIGAGPARLLPDLLGAMAPEAVLVLSFNQDTLRDADYAHSLAEVQVSGLARVEYAIYGPQLPAMNRFATIYGLRRL